MKMNYSTPEIELVKFNAADVLAASGTGGGGIEYNPDAIEDGLHWNAGRDNDGFSIID